MVVFVFHRHFPGVTLRDVSLEEKENNDF